MAAKSGWKWFDVRRSDAGSTRCMIGHLHAARFAMVPDRHRYATVPEWHDDWAPAAGGITKAFP
jgi:hypothetical protein